MKNKVQNFIYVITLTMALFFTGGLLSFSTDGNIPAAEEDVIGGAYLTFANKFGGTVTQKDLNRTDEIGVDGCAKGSRIFQFKLKITKNGKTTSYEGTSPSLTKTMLTDLRNLTKGDEFIFKRVKAYLPDGESEVDVWGKKFTVV
ncbi:MAG: hypothetical protein AB8F94_00675 [Saprospiraceae bacterium]